MLLTKTLVKYTTSSIAAIGIVAGVGMLSIPAQAIDFTGPTTLNNLLLGTNNRFIIDDKAFSNFFYIANGDAQPKSATDVTVFGADGDTLNPKITFFGGFTGSQVGNADIALGFKVDVLDPLKKIIGFDLSIGGFTSTADFNVNTDVLTAFGGTRLGGVEAVVKNSNVTYNPSQEISFQPRESLFVQQDIKPNANGSINFSIDTKSFLQHSVPVPEPSNILGLITISALGVGTLLKRKSSFH